MPPKTSEPATLMLGKTEDGEVIPKAAGLAVSLSMKSMRTRFRPARNSLVTVGEKTWV